MAGATSPASIIFFPPRIVAEMRPSQRGFGPRLDRGGPSATASGGCHRPPWAMSALREGVGVESQSAAPTAHPQGRANCGFSICAVRAFGRYRESFVTYGYGTKLPTHWQAPLNGRYRKTLYKVTLPSTLAAARHYRTHSYSTQDHLHFFCLGRRPGCAGPGPQPGLTVGVV